jgi:hypothetical protein
MIRALTVALALLLLNGCPAKEKKNEPVTTCTSAGATCVYAPGKLGLCVESVDGNPRFICQSQH